MNDDSHQWSWCSRRRTIKKKEKKKTECSTGRRGKEVSNVVFVHVCRCAFKHDLAAFLTILWSPSPVPRSAPAMFIAIIRRRTVSLPITISVSTGTTTHVWWRRRSTTVCAAIMSSTSIIVARIPHTSIRVRVFSAAKAKRIKKLAWALECIVLFVFSFPSFSSSSIVFFIVSIHVCPQLPPTCKWMRKVGLYHADQSYHRQARWLFDCKGLHPQEATAN